MTSSVRHCTGGRVEKTFGDGVETGFTSCLHSQLIITRAWTTRHEFKTNSVHFLIFTNLWNQRHTGLTNHSQRFTAHHEVCKSEVWRFSLLVHKLTQWRTPENIESPSWSCVKCCRETSVTSHWGTIWKMFLLSLIFMLIKIKTLLLILKSWRGSVLLSSPRNMDTPLSVLFGLMLFLYYSKFVTFPS